YCKRVSRKRLHYSKSQKNQDTKVQFKPRFLLQTRSSKQTVTKRSQPEIVNKSPKEVNSCPSLRRSSPRQRHIDTRHTKKLPNFHSRILTRAPEKRNWRGINFLLK
ncbi:hypothetical protein LINPERHAP1_LOCUS4596, partial [Linum perenne]